jgi:hypothetical protein
LIFSHGIGNRAGIITLVFAAKKKTFSSIQGMGEFLSKTKEGRRSKQLDRANISADLRAPAPF